MAERLVLAELVIDENGVVSGLAKVNAGLKNTENQSEQTGKKVGGLSGLVKHLENDMFSMRRIANAVLAGFTVAGAIQGIRSLIDAVLEQNSVFQGMKSLASDVFTTLTAGEDRIKTTTSLMIELAGALNSSAINLLKFRQENENFNEAFKKLNDEADKALSKGALVGMFRTIFGFDLPGASAVMKQIQQTIKDVGTLRGTSNKPAPKALRIPAGEGIGPAVGESEFNPLQAQRITPAAGAAFSAFGEGNFLPPPKVLSNFRVAVTSVLESLSDLHTRMTGVQFAAQATSEAFQQAGSAIGAALSGEAVSGAQVLKSILSSIAKQAAVEGLFELAKGFGALFAPGGQAAAASHFKSSALFFATAALAGGGARAIGGGGATSGGGVGAPSGTRGFGQEIGQQPRAQTQNLTVIVQGNVVGNEAFVRQLVVDVQRQLLAGTGGGGF